jgi:drug/metabolite transporter (DMT)-like permease
MSVTILTVVLFGAFLHAAWNVFIRAATDKHLTTVQVAGSAGLLTACWLPFTPAPAVPSWPYLTASVLIHVVYFSFVAQLYRKTDLSFAYPIMRGSAPALSAVVALLLLSESPSSGGWSGLLLVSAGIIILAGDSWRSGSLRFSPTMLALANAGVIVAYTLVDGVGVRLSGNPAGYTGWLFFLTAIPLFVMYFATERLKGVKQLWTNCGKGLMGGACSVGSYGLALWAMTQAPIALVAALREPSVVFGTLLAAGFLRERVTPLRYLSILVVTAGAVAIKMS